MEKKNINLKEELEGIIKAYKTLSVGNTKIIKRLKNLSDNELILKNQITEQYFAFVKDVEDIIRKIESEKRNNHLVIFYLENLKRGVK